MKSMSLTSNLGVRGSNPFRRAIGFLERSGDLGCAVLRFHRCQMTSGPINVSSKLKKEVGAMHRDNVGCPSNVFQFGMERLHPGGIDLREQRFIDHPESAI